MEPAAAVQWDMPAGNLRHGPLVAAATVAAVGCTAAAVLVALLLPEWRSRAKQQ